VSDVELLREQIDLVELAGHNTDLRPSGSSQKDAVRTRNMRIRTRASTTVAGATSMS
jgi:hypothetical protein